MTAVTAAVPATLTSRRAYSVAHAIQCLRENMAINRDLVRQVHADPMAVPEKLRILAQLETERVDLQNGIWALEATTRVP